MVPSPEEDRSLWEGVELESARHLVELMLGKASTERKLLQRRFGERARGFNEALNYLEAIQALRVEGQSIHSGKHLELMKEALALSRQDFMKCLIRISIASASGYGREIREVCRAFRFEEGKAQMKSERLGREHHAGRNILLEGGAVRIDHKSGICTISNWFHSDFIEVLYAHGTTPEELNDLITDQSDIGFAAELEVLKFERYIVGDKDANKVMHIALQNTNAGFDIASIRRQKDTDQLTVRLIEVKAVSLKDWNFVFTRNEVRVATENKSVYFLYLVPVVKGQPRMDQAYVLENPVDNLLEADEWRVAQGDWKVCRKVHHA